MNTLTTTIIDARSPTAQEVWQALEARARPPYFLSWPWMQHWLTSLPSELVPDLVVLRAGQQPVCAFFLGHVTLVRHGFVLTSVGLLNATGIPQLDDICLEHNAVLRDPDFEVPLSALVEAIPGEWDELVLPALSKVELPGSSLAQGVPGYRVVIDREVPAPFVDLDRVRATRDYLSLISSSTRAHVRRAGRAFGSVSLQAARDSSEALAFFDELVSLNRVRWHDQHAPSAFDDPWFTSFHRRLIEKRAPHGEVELLRLQAAGKTLGCLYNLVSNGRVLFYQSGMERFDDPHKKPGYVAHAMAIERAAAAGHHVYDFLAGSAGYKRSLATDEAPLVWARIQRPHLRFALEEGLRHLKHTAMAHVAQR